MHNFQVLTDKTLMSKSISDAFTQRRSSLASLSSPIRSNPLDKLKYGRSIRTTCTMLGIVIVFSTYFFQFEIICHLFLM